MQQNPAFIQGEVEKTLQIVKSGGVILYPTDTVWGLGCDASNETAVAKVFQIKQRSESKSLILLLDEASKLNRYIHEVPYVAWDLVELSDKPLTIIYSGAYNLPKNVINKEDGSIAFRVTQDDFCKQLICKLNKPLVSTSANISGQPTPGFFKQISPEIINAVDYVVQLRQQETTAAKPSTLMKIEENGTFAILRK